MWSLPLGDGEGVLGPSLDDPVALLFVAVPQHQAARLETIPDEDDLFVEAGAVELDIVGGSPVSSILSPPLSLDGESLGQREVEWVDNSLGETSEEVHACMSLPGEGPIEIGQAVFSPALSTFAPMVLAVTSAIVVTVGIDAFVADGSEQMPGKGHLLSSGRTPVPVGVADGLLLVVPVGGIVLSLKVVDLPEVTVDSHTWLRELDVLVDVGGVSSTAFDFQGDDAVDISFSVASLGGNPMGRPLSTNVSSKNGTPGDKVLSNARNVTRPSTLGTGNGVGRPDVRSVLTVPMPGHMEGVLLSWVLLMTTLEPSETVVAQASPNPGAVIERRTLTRGSVNIGNTIYASCRARGRHEVAIESAAHVPRVVQGRHDDVWALGSRFDKVSPSSALLSPCTLR